MQLRHIIGYTAVLCLAVAGTAQALPGRNTVDSGDIRNGQVKNVDVRGGAVTSQKVRDHSLRAADLGRGSIGTGVLANNSITGDDINESRMNFGNVCKAGLVKGYARVKASSGLPAGYTDSTTWIEHTHNCAGGDVEVRRTGTGLYNVRLAGNPGDVAQVSAQSNVNVVSVSQTSLTGVFLVGMRDINGVPVDHEFMITVF